MPHADGPPASATGALRAETLRGASGFYRVGRDANGRWWLLDPGDRPFFAKAVHGVRPLTASPEGIAPAHPSGALRQWGFNSVGVESAGELWEDGMPFLGSVQFCRAGAVMVAPGLRLPDVFDPEWPRLAIEHARQHCAPHVENRALLGWVTDDRLDWASAPANAAAQPSSPVRPSLLQLCLSLEPGFPAYHAAWEFVLALHAGRLDAVARAWGVPVRNKEVVRELTRAEQGIATRGYARDEARWAREFARRYFTATAAAVRAADPNHLVFGARALRPAGPHVLAECAYPAIDVALLHWSELPPPGAASLHPVFAGEVAWATEEFTRPAAGRSRRLTSVERMLQRARQSLERMVRHSSVVGYAWSQWQDEPGEQPPFGRGLVHVNGAEAREHTELLSAFNARAETLRRQPPPSPDRA